MPGKPNVIIVMTDQQRADLRKGEGFSCDTMPFLDTLAANGRDFRRAYTPAPICMPARAAMFTGRFPSALHTTSNQSGFEHLLYKQDMMDTLKGAGYRTALCGKNHSYLRADDFDYAFLTSHHGGSGDDRTKDEEAFDTYMRELRHRTDFEPAPFGVEVQCPYRNVTHALDWVDTIDDNPFFLWLSFPEPHNPYQVPKPYFSMFEDAPVPETGSDALIGKGPKYRWLRSAWEEAIPDFDSNVVRTRKNYLGMLKLIDDQLKRFHDGLDERGLLSNTYIFFVSDHGDFVGDYGLIRKGPELAEALCRIPFIVTGPSVDASESPENAAVSLVDIFPTVCEAIGVDIPEGVQGRSILPILKGEPYPREEFSSMYSEHGFGGHYLNGDEDLTLAEEGALNDGCTFDCLNSWTQCGTARMVREGDYKLVFDMLGTGQLYNIENDPLELENLFGSDTCSEVRERLMATMLKWQMRVADNALYPVNRYRYKKHPRNYLWGAGDEDQRLFTGGK